MMSIDLQGWLWPIPSRISLAATPMTFTASPSASWMMLKALQYSSLDYNCATIKVLELALKHSLPPPSIVFCVSPCKGAPLLRCQFLTDFSACSAAPHISTTPIHIMQLGNNEQG